MKSTRLNTVLFVGMLAVIGIAQAVGHPIVGLDDLGMIGIGMTTLAANKPRSLEQGNRNEFLVIAADILYEGSAIGLVDATGHARPLNAADRFAGFAEYTVDNSAGAAAAPLRARRRRVTRPCCPSPAA